MSWPRFPTAICQAGNGVVAVADDGSMWLYSAAHTFDGDSVKIGEWEWQRLPDLPPNDSPPDTSTPP